MEKGVNSYPHIATMEADPIPHGGTNNQDDPSSVATLRRVDATGFIRLNGLRPASGIEAKVHGKKK
jgi:hypothetical protein